MKKILKHKREKEGGKRKRTYENHEIIHPAAMMTALWAFCV